MPRASYGDRHCISVVHNGQQTAFDFTSRVIDFTVLVEADPAAGRRALEVGVLGRCKNEGFWVHVPKPVTLQSLGLIILLCKANDLCLSLQFSQAVTQSGMPYFQATPLACPNPSLRDLAQLGQICVAGFMPVQLGERVLA